MLIKAKGQMYPWIDCLINYIAGACPHACKYCYVAKMGEKFPGVKKKYSGCLRFLEKELKENLYKFGEGISIFPQNNGDLFAEAVPREWILKVLEHCMKYPKNTYLFQTKNPSKFMFFGEYFPPNTILGTTIETNKYNSVSKAPSAYNRAAAIKAMSKLGYRTMVSVEPVMDFDLDVMVSWLKEIRPEFVSIGADSKNSNLPEPPAWKVRKLIEELKKFTEVKVKSNLKRILKGDDK